jgi:hypothetical protein
MMARRAAEWVFTTSALGEIAVGLLGAVLPGPVMGFLLGAPVDGTGAIAARMMGIGVAALGLAWWPDRNALDARRGRQVAPAFVGYNAGVGLLFASHALTASRLLPVSWLVAVVHLAFGGAFVLLVYREPAPRESVREQR